MNTAIWTNNKVMKVYQPNFLTNGSPDYSKLVSVHNNVTKSQAKKLCADMNVKPWNFM